MSVVPLDWSRIETETPAAGAPVGRPSNGRDAVFRSALGSYIADYERHLATIAAERERRERRVPRTLAGRLAQRLWG